ncbi:LysR family transcriptional regulator [Pseudomaricurvus alkylphenolicus]|uniref:LysR family transcriptional regulator n=1 Tax=Pseudomaricurvus alkylphenolicus TaxID=1306991 RepID=UPI001421D067|nr:LysR family transcriptional regulator [Pseudomaricurvus alkylphenolicus]NIB44031.1 LysR family transcriptional regulator [Pseudomaricurvus alkylphenolicus]
MGRKQTALLGQLSDIDLRLLRVFRAVAEAGGVSAAELELNIGRSTISRHLKDLEVRLGVSLCRRGRGGFALTEEGQQIYQSTLRLLGSLESFRSEVADVHKRLTGHISLALFDKTASNPESRIGEAMARFDDLAPEVSLDIYVEPINEIERGVMEGRFQLGVIPTHRSSPSLAYQHLFFEQMFLYCGRDHVLFDLDDAEVDGVLVLESKYAGLGYHSPNMEVGNRLGLQRDVTVNDQEAIVHCLRSGRYVGYLPDHYAAFFVQQGLIRPLLPETYHYECDFVAIHRISPKPSRIVATFLECLAGAHSC